MTIKQYGVQKWDPFLVPFVTMHSSCADSCAFVFTLCYCITTPCLNGAPKVPGSDCSTYPPKICSVRQAFLKENM
jgi:hypothetical protein